MRAKSAIPSLALLPAALMACAVVAHADVFNMGGTRNPDGTWTGPASLEMVTVGDPGNAPDTRYETPGCGTVPRPYAIGKFEVTAGQYTAFLNAVAKKDTYGLYSSFMAGWSVRQLGTNGNYTYIVDANGDGIEDADRVNRPVNYVGFWDAARFANWLHNGQPTGLLTGIPAQDAWLTEDGAYTLNGYTAWDGRTITRNPAARLWIPDEDEWYKAAYYKGGGTNAGYWTYPTRSDTRPINTLLTPDPGNHANFYDAYGTGNGTYTIGDPLYMTEVGAFTQSYSAYSTFDQGGNLYEYTDTQRTGYYFAGRVTRGGSFYPGGTEMAAYARTDTDPSLDYYNCGFRVAGLPEPSNIMMLLGASVMALLFWWRRRAWPFR